MLKKYSRIRLNVLATVFYGFAAVSVVFAADPVVVEVHYQNGVKFYNRGMTERAEQEFHKTLELDPGHQEAKVYLEKIRSRGAQAVVVDEGDEKRFAPLYEEGKRLFRQKDYEKAIEAFDNILQDSPIDRTASLYRERCEAAIARRLIREKSREEKDRIKEEARAARSARAEKKEEKKAISKRRKEITSERRQGAAEEARVEAAAVETEREPAPARPRKDSGRRLKEKKKAAVKKQAHPLEQFKDSKELFLKGVEHYGRKEYAEAVRVFQELIQWEAERRQLRYTNASRRFMEKAKKKISMREREGDEEKP